MLVDTEGLVIAVALHEASIADRDGAKLLLEKVGESVGADGEGLGRQQRLQRQDRRVDEGAAWLDPADRKASAQVGEGTGR